MKCGQDTSIRFDALAKPTHDDISSVASPIVKNLDLGNTDIDSPDTVDIISTGFPVLKEISLKDISNECLQYLIKQCATIKKINIRTSASKIRFNEESLALIKERGIDLTTLRGW